MATPSIVAARLALRDGDLHRAESLTSQIGAADLEALTLRSEILFLCGHSQRAAELSADVLLRIERNDGLRAQAFFVAGACAWELGDGRAGAEMLERAEGPRGGLGSFPGSLTVLERSDAECRITSLPLWHAVRSRSSEW